MLDADSVIRKSKIVAILPVVAWCVAVHWANVRAAEPTPNVALRVLVVNDLALAEAIGRLRGEWAERFGGTLTAETKAWADLADAKSLDADVVVFPTRYLGELYTRGWLR